LEQNFVKVGNLSDSISTMPRETQRAFTCHNQRQLRHVSLNIIIIALNI